MGKRLPVPQELEHLIEKREAEGERRRAEQRSTGERRGEDDLGPLGAIESAADLGEVPTDDRRGDEPRRQSKERRRRQRRKKD